MFRKISLAAATLACALIAPVTPFTAASASAAPAPVPVAVKGQSIQEIKTELARELPRALADRAARSALYQALAGRGEADLLAVTARSASVSGARFAAFAVSADRAVKRIKGLNGMTGSSLRVRLANPETAGRLAPGARPLFAATPADEKAAALVAYDLDGHARVVDLTTRPSVPLLVVELDIDRVIPAAVTTVRAELRHRGVSSAAFDRATARPVQPGGVATAESKIVTKMDTIRLADDQEPWISGRAEIYALVLGQGQDGKARADVVEMPYLDYDNTTYTPGQGIIDWPNFKWNAVDFLIMEHDDNINYRELARAVAAAIATLADGAQYIPLINAVLDALPDSWLTNDDDYVDSYYMLMRTSAGSVPGAANNARMSIRPVVVTT
jgi:Protein of unknown function (DUF3103)